MRINILLKNGVRLYNDKEDVMNQDKVGWKERSIKDRPAELEFAQQWALACSRVMQPLHDDGALNSEHNALYNGGNNPIDSLSAEYLFATQTPDESLWAVSELHENGKTFAHSSVYRRVCKEKGQVNGAAASVDISIKGKVDGKEITVPCEQKAFTALQVSHEWAWTDSDSKKVQDTKREQVRQCLLQGVSYDTSVGMGGLTFLRWIQEGLPLLMFVQNGEYGVFVNLTRLWKLMSEREEPLKTKYPLEAHINEYLKSIGSNEFKPLRKGFRWKPHRAVAWQPRTALPLPVMEKGVQVRKDGIPDWVHPKLVISFDEVPKTILAMCSSKAYTLREVIEGKFHLTRTFQKVVKS